MAHTPYPPHRPAKTSPVPSAMQCLLLGLAVGSGTGILPGGNLAYAQADRPSASTRATLDDGNLRSYAIATDSLGTALATFATQSGLLLSFDPALTQGLKAPALEGRHTIRAGLAHLLAGSGLEVVARGNGGYSLRKIAPASSPTENVQSLETVEIRAEGLGGSGNAASVATQSYGANKTETAIVEIPQSVSVVTRKQMDEMGAQNVQDAVGYLAGVDTGTYGKDSRVEEIWVRGYRTGGFGNYMYVDGLRPPGSSSGGGALSTRFDSYGLEQVEVLKGPSSGLYGQVAPGGLINIRSKRPPQKQQRQMGLQTDTDGLIRANLDMGGPLDAENQWLYRLVSSASHTGTQVDHVELNRFFFNPTLTWQPSTRTSLTLLGNYQQDRGGNTAERLPAMGTILESPHGTVSRTFFQGEPGFNRYDRNQTAIGYSLEQFIGESAKLRQNVRYIEVDMIYDNVERRTLASDGHTLTGTAESNENHGKGFSADTNLLYAWDAGPVTHMLLAGFDYHWTDVDLSTAAGTVGPLDLFAPVYGATPVTIGERTPNREDSRIQQGIYLQDQIFWNNWTVTAGLRHDMAKTKVIQLARDTRTDTSAEASTGRLGVNYLFANGLAPYASYSTSFVPASSGQDYYGNPFDPIEGEQIEVGIKYQPTSSRNLVTAALYEITQSNILTTDPDPTHLCDGRTCQVQSGENQVRGLELEGIYTLTQALSINGSYTYIDAKITELNSTNKGNRMARSPRHMASARFNYRMAPGLNLGMGVRYTGSSYGNDANTVKNSARTLVDASLRYDLQKLDERLRGLHLSMNINNLLDKDYVTCNGPTGFCYYHPNRVVSASLTYDW
ncbi:iron complex outermembrane recepter protein [Lampropedia hyalina DSM 16112]|uniref:Iron complex outermembrane recepter protein n=1 Tax=Lampropedia hyalina DSM 16112 TaxID=1122156 RepID=A0A1M4U4T3_9BURK|nr:TonB-dependent siderophore receptor [Lampropedia hyalina]SHE51759.1 iron complex outermembrane recepter protein [Lampropedia hyalina DSM 16112]